MMNEVVEFILTNESIFIPLFITIEIFLVSCMIYCIYTVLVERDDQRLEKAKHLCQKHHSRD